MKGERRLFVLSVALTLGLAGAWWACTGGTPRGPRVGVEPTGAGSGSADSASVRPEGELAPIRSHLASGVEIVGEGGFVDLEVTGIDPALPALEVLAHAIDPARPGGLPVGLGQELGVRDGRATARLALPAEVELYLSLVGPGLRWTTRSRPFALEPGEVRTLRIDLGEACNVEGRVHGLPAPHQRSARLHLAPRSTPGAERPPHPHPAPLEAELDPDGRFTFAGLTPGAVSISLALGADAIALVDGEGRSSWPACPGAHLELHLARPLVGLAPVDELGQPLHDEPFAPIPNRGPSGDPRLHPGGVALVPLEEVSAPARIGLYLPRRGIHFRDPRLSAPLAGEVLPIPVGRALAGSIRVHCGEPLSPSLVVDFEHHGPEGPSRLLGLQVAALRRGSGAGAVRLERLEDGARLVGLPPGLYDLFWSWGGRRPLAAGVRVEAGIETSVGTPAPRLRQLQVRVAGWHELPPELRPVELVLEGHHARIQDGAARVEAFEPAPLEVLVRHWDFFWWSRPLPLLQDGEAFVLELPLSELRILPLEVAPILGGRIVAELEHPAALRALLPDLPATRPVQPRDDGAPRILYEARFPPSGWVREYGPDFHLVHGRLEAATLADGLPPAFAGAWRDLTLSPPGLRLELLLEAPSAPSHPVPLTVADTSAPLRLWLPAGPLTLLLRDAQGREHRHPLDGNRTRLEIEVP